MNQDQSQGGGKRHEQPEGKIHQSPCQQAIAACHRAASTIQTSFQDSELRPVIEMVQGRASFAGLRGVSVVIVDDSQDVLRNALPILVAATGDKATLIHIDPYRTVMQEEIIKKIVDAQPQVVLLDGMLGQNFDGAMLARTLAQKHPDITCVGFSSTTNSFAGAPVLGAVAKNANSMVVSLERVTRLVQGKKELSRPDMLVALSIMCDGIVLTQKTPEALRAMNVRDGMIAKITSTQARENFQGPENWKNVFLAGNEKSCVEALCSQVPDPEELPTCFCLMRKLDEGTLETVSLEDAQKMLSEIKAVLSNVR